MNANFWLPNSLKIFVHSRLSPVNPNFQTLSQGLSMYQLPISNYRPHDYFHAFFIRNASSSITGLSHKIRPPQPNFFNALNRSFHFRSASSTGR